MKIKQEYSQSVWAGSTLVLLVSEAAFHQTGFLLVSLRSDLIPPGVVSRQEASYRCLPLVTWEPRDRESGGREGPRALL